MHSRSRNLLLLAFAALVVAFSFPAGSQADLNTGHYSHFWSSCQSTEPSRADPIGAIYWGANAPGYDHNLYNQANHVYQHAGWWGTSQSTQYFPNHGQCIPQDGGQETGGSSRYHQRIRRNLDYTVGLEYVTLATPHYEVTIHCGHAVTRNSTHPSGWSGYDIARQALSDAFINQDQHWMYVEAWGNTQSQVQCDPSWTPFSLGNVRFIYIPGWYH